MGTDFPENLIKGKIVETVFQQMFLEADLYEMYSFEATVDFSSIQHLSHHKDIQNIIDGTSPIPQCIIVPKGKSEVYIVSTMYNPSYHSKELVETAQKLHHNWDYAWLFLATDHHLHFDSCWNIMNSHGHMDFLPYTWIPRDLQEKYRTLLRQFLS